MRNNRGQHGGGPARSSDDACTPRQELGTANEAIQNFKEEFFLCSGDENTEDTSAMDDNTSDNALDIAATLNNVLDSSNHSKTASVKSPKSGS